MLNPMLTKILSHHTILFLHLIKLISILKPTRTPNLKPIVNKQINGKLFQMIPLFHDKICTIFLHSWLNLNGHSLDHLETKKLGKRFKLTNSQLLNSLEADYAEFLRSRKSLEDFFDRQIIICRGDKKLFKIKVDKIYKIPIFIFQTTKNNTFLFGPDMTNLTSTNAIPCDLKIIMGFYGISKWPKNLSNFEPECGRSVSVYKVLKGKAYYDIESVSEIADIPLGLSKKQYYFIPNPKLIKGRYFCQKYPGHCLYNTQKVGNRDRHEKICSDDSIVSAKQVEKFIKNSF